jgi:hypothetical protein
MYTQGSPCLGLQSLVHVHSLEGILALEIFLHILMSKVINPLFSEGR